MADSFFGFDTSLSNLNDDEGGGDGSEEEYDALNDETFGTANESLDWEKEHEQLAHALESSRRHEHADHISPQHLEARLSQLVLDEPDTPLHSLGSNVWRHDPPLQLSTPQPLKNVCTVEELERQLRQKHQQTYTNYYQPRFPVILQRPPGLQGPVPLPFVPQPQANQMTQPINTIIPQANQMGQSNQMMPNHVNQMGQNVNQMGQNLGQMGQNMNQIGQNVGQIGQNVNQMGQNLGQIGQSVNLFMQHGQSQFQNNHAPNNLVMSQNMHQSNQMMQNQIGLNQNMGQNVNKMVQNSHMGQNASQMPPMSQNMNQMGQNMNQMGQNVTQMGPNVNQMGQNVMPNGNQFDPMTQFYAMSQNRMMVPPPGMNMPRQNFSPNMAQFNHNFRGPIGKPNEQPNMIMDKQIFLKNQQMNALQPNTSQLNHSNPQNLNPMGQNVNQMGQNLNQKGQNVNTLSQNQMSQNVNPMNQTVNPLGQIVNPNINQLPQNMNHIGPNVNQMGQNVNPIGQNVNPNGQNVNPMGQNVNQMAQNVNQMGQNVNQIGQNLNQMGQNVTQIGQNVNQMAQNFNQMGQNVQNASVSPNKGMKTDKKQPTRVYNNSSVQNNITSQNLMHLIHNTHRMLQFNSGFHNATHHPLLNRTQFNNINHPILNPTQRHNGSFSSSGTRSMVNGDGDEYAGLMTSREKQWLVNIQMLQLNTGTPYIHDFYYTVFCERQAQKEKEVVKEAHKANQQNHPFYSGGVKPESSRRERHNSIRNSTGDEGTARAYVPAQFENSLGKLQCGSVTAPRKIIDLEVVGAEAGRSAAPSRASASTPAEVPRELKRTKQLLLDIEALYLILLRLEELNDPLAISNALILKEREEKQKQLEAIQKELENEQEDESNVFLKNIESVQRRPKQDSPKSETIDKRQVCRVQVVSVAASEKPAPAKNLLDEDRDELLGRMFAALLHADRLPAALAVRKGRTLVCRLMALVSPSHARVRGVWGRVLRAAATLARRHDAGALAALAPHYCRYIECSSGWGGVLEGCGLLAEALDPARTPHVLTTPFTLTCVCALVEKASTLINTPDPTANERQWSKFLKTLARALKNATVTVARPLRPLPEHKLTNHLKQIDSRSTIEILQRGKTAEFDLTKTDVHEQLVKHLCV